MKMLLIVYLFVGLFACQTQEENSTADASYMVENPSPRAKEAAPIPEEPMAPPPPQPEIPQQITTPPNQSAAKPIERQIIRNANVSFQVEEVNKSSKKIEATVNQLGGFISSSEETRTADQLRHSLTARVPAAKLDTFLTLLLKESIYTESKTITSEDVTKRYVDLEARIKAKKVTEEKYLELLKKARNVDEVLKVEAQLGQIREDRETREAELRELKNDVAMSTVQAFLYQKTESANEPSSPFYVKIWDSFTEGFTLLSGTFLAFFYILPLLAAFSLIVWLFRRWWRKRKKQA
ncbi:DUF4349 domain-containing protein [Runella sp.]|uniref:DUF4349 domain-containing protein n=1 Tax=Runella sp. TaxID=1960881 RepID=UPI003D12F2A4